MGAGFWGPGVLSCCALALSLARRRTQTGNWEQGNSQDLTGLARESSPSSECFGSFFRTQCALSRVDEPCAPLDGPAIHEIFWVIVQEPQRICALQPPSVDHPQVYTASRVMSSSPLDIPPSRRTVSSAPCVGQ
ncbi:uncharacterized protein IWZ02DRAFT_313807 [Phyllosticta citriasiana]|uniref:uncharacterized protein n=1 Tax=Phyllosticta citriasiana TaxID=595635 RepID=UPI0030FD3D38